MRAALKGLFGRGDGEETPLISPPQQQPPRQQLEATQPPPPHFPQNTSSVPPPTLDPRDLTVLGAIGAGAFGLVHIARHNQTQQPVALKQINKAKVLQGKHLPHVLSERNILASIRSPFLVNLLGTFQDDHFLYIAMEFVPGGEFFTYLVMVGSLPEDHARVYAAHVLLALEALHERQVAFRDLKPENVLVGIDGYLKLTDLGFAKVVPEKTYTLCGTPEYTAPETILGTGHGITADYWSLGILIYEMLMARAPFQDEDLSMLYAKILRGTYKEPPASPPCKDAIRGLLCVDPAKRLGAGGVAEIRRHPWFAVLDWEAIQEKQIVMPYIPNLRGPFDASNFEPVDPNNPLLRPPAVVLSQQQQQLFDGF